MRKVSIIFLCLAIIFSLCSCSLSENETNEKNELNNPYSRETVNELVSSAGFGRGSTDVTTVVLDFVYNDPFFSEKYGDDFCVDDIGGSHEETTFFFMWLYEASGDYFVDIKGDTWWISVSKSYFGKWKVTGYSQEINEGDG